MLVMVSNQTSWRTHYLQGKYGGLGLLLPPNGVRGPYPHLPYAMDNGAFPAWKNGEPWDEAAFLKSLEWAKERPVPPRWVVVPDVVTQPEETFRAWDKWAPAIEATGFPTAFAAQDGMTPQMVKDNHIEADVIFVGGTRDWKMNSVSSWTEAFPRVHVGRINGMRGLMWCHERGVESTDGTGFFRGDRKQLGELIAYLRDQGEGQADHPMYLPIESKEPSLFDGKEEV